MHDANEAQQKTTYLVPIVRHNRTDGRLKRQELSIVQLGPVPNQCVEESGPAAQVSGGRQLVALVLRSSIRQMQNLEAKRREMFFVWTSLICSVQDKSLHCIFSRKLQAWFVPPPASFQVSLEHGRCVARLSQIIIKHMSCLVFWS